MIWKVLLALALVPTITTAGPADSAASKGNIVLLHGLARSSSSMEAMEEQLVAEGYRTCNVSYPSRKHRIEDLTDKFVRPAIIECFGEDAGPVSFVTHSLGGIIVRQLAASNPALPFGRVVMLSPPNHGSEVVDVLGDIWLFKAINGPAGRQLGTSASSIPNSLGPAPFQVGVITGSRTINFILSAMIRGDDDGKVSIESAKLEGMADFLVIPATHPFIMKNSTAIAQTLHFLEHGRFRGTGDPQVVSPSE